MEQKELEIYAEYNAGEISFDEYEARVKSLTDEL